MPSRGATQQDRLVCFNVRKVASLRRRLPPMPRLVDVADRHRAQAHPMRLAILELLGMEECCVCDLAHILEQPVSTISQHLKTLRKAGLVRSRQDGKLVFYAASPEGASADPAGDSRWTCTPDD